MALVVRAFPVDDRVRVDSFVREMRDRESEAREFYTEPRRAPRIVVLPERSAPAQQRRHRRDRRRRSAGSEGGAVRRRIRSFSTWFKAHVYALSGVDPDTDAARTALTEMVHDSSRRTSYRPGARSSCAPIRCAIVRSWRSSSASCASKAGGNARRSTIGTASEEAWFLQNTEDGEIVIAVLAVDDPEGAAKTLRRIERSVRRLVQATRDRGLRRRSEPARRWDRRANRSSSSPLTRLH